MRMRHIVICGLPRSVVFFHRISKGTIWGGGGGVEGIENKICVLIFSTAFV